MDSQGSSRRSSACNSEYSTEDIDTCGLENEQVRLIQINRGFNSSLILIKLQIKTLKRTFDQFDSKKTGALCVNTVHTILKMMGMHVTTRALEVGNYLIKFESS